MQNKKVGIALASLVVGMLTTHAANASHFRGGSLVPSVDANGLVTITSTTYWRKNATRGTSSVGGEGVVRVNGINIGSHSGTRVVDQSDARFGRVVEVYSYQLAAAGTFDFEWTSCCHVSGIQNVSQSSEDLNSKIVWDGSTANTPILFDLSAVNPEVIRGLNYSDNLGAVSGSGQTLTYDQALSLSVNSQIPGFVINPATGQMTIAAADTANMTYDNPNNLGADYGFSGNINASDGSSVEFEWLFDAVNTGSGNLAPTVNDMVINVFQGDVLNATVTGTDPEGQPLTWNLQSLFGPGNTSAFNFNNLTQLISWDTAGVALGQYIANIRASDGSLSDVGTITINVVNRPSGNIPEPGILSLLGLGILSLGFIRRRKVK